MTSSNRNVAYTHQGVRAGGVNLKVILAIFQTEAHLDAAGLADPVTLHGLYLVWPTIQLVEIVQKFFCVIRDTDKPLWNFFALDHSVTAPAASVDDLLVGQYGLVIRTPVHR